MRHLTFIALALAGFCVSRPASATPSLCSKVRVELRQLKAALEFFSIEHGEYPSTSEGLQRLESTGFLDPADINDPWGRPYVYERTPSGFLLLTLGPDAIRGTKDDLEVSQIDRGCPAWSRPVPRARILVAAFVAALCLGGVAWGIKRVLRRPKTKGPGDTCKRSGESSRDGSA